MKTTMILPKIKKLFSNVSRYHKMLLTYVAILMLSIIFIEVLNFSVIRNQNYSILKSNIAAESEKQINILNSQFEVMNKMAMQFRNNKSFYARYQETKPTAYINIEQIFKDSSAWTDSFSEVYFYDKKEKYVISSRGKENEFFFFKEIINTDKDIAFDKIPYGNIATVNAHALKMNKDIVLFIMPVERVHYKMDEGTSFLMFSVPINSISELFSQNVIDENYKNLIYFQGSPIVSSDDEINQRIYRNEQFEFYEAESSCYYSSFEDGFVKVEWEVPKTIYDKSLFSLLAKQALLIFAVLAIGIWAIYFFTQKSYQPLKTILKSIPPKYKQAKLSDEFKYLDFVLNDLLYSRDVFEDSFIQMKQERYLYYILDNQVQKDSALYQQCMDENIRLDRNLFCCILIDDVVGNQSIYQYFNNEFLQYSQHSNIYSLYIMGERYLFLLCSDMSKEELQNLINQDLSEYDIKDAQIGVGEVVRDISQVRTSYYSAQAKLLHALNSDALPASAETLYPIVEIEALEEAFSVENIDKVEFSLRMIKHDADKYNPFMRSAILLNCATVLHNGNMEEAFSSFSDAYHISQEYMENKVDQMFAEYLKRVEKTPIQKEVTEQRTHHRNIKDIIQYVEQNYSSPDFSIKGMAADFETSSSNLSHYFKKTTGKTLSQYIDGLKMNKALELLEDGNIKISDIASILCYSSTSAFIEVFKRNQDMTPRAYREYNQKG